MADQKLSDASSGEQPKHEFVAKFFVEKYYLILQESPEVVHKFYKDESVIDRPGAGGEMTSATTMKGINEMIMSSDYKGCSAEIIHVVSQESLMRGIFLAVTGYLTWKDNVKRKFSQTFFLAKQEKGFFVLNDIFSLDEESEPLTTAANADQQSIASPASRDPLTRRTDFDSEEDSMWVVV